MHKVMIATIAALMLSACVSDRAASIKGACDAFQAPAAPVRGKARADQRWIDGQIESGVSACGWRRPVSAGVS